MPGAPLWCLSRPGWESAGLHLQLAAPIDHMAAPMGEEHQAVRVNEDGEVETKFGFEISAGPRTYRLLITYPLAKEGLIEEIPRDAIESIDKAKPGPRRERPEIVESE